MRTTTTIAHRKGQWDIDLSGRARNSAEAAGSVRNACSMLPRLLFSNRICYHSKHLGLKVTLFISGLDLHFLESSYAPFDLVTGGCGLPFL